MWLSMQPHQFPYCSYLHLSKRLKQNTPYSPRPWMDSECQNSGAPQTPVPLQTKPIRRPVRLPLAKRSLAVKVQAVGLGGPVPAHSTPGSGIPLLSPSAVRGRRWEVSGSAPSALPRPKESRDQNRKRDHLPELKCSRKQVSETSCPASLRPRRHV